MLFTFELNASGRVLPLPALFLLLGLVLAGCAISGDGATVVTRPVEVLDSAIRQQPQTPELTEAERARLPGSIAILPFVNRTDSTEAFEIVRTTIYNHLASKNYHCLHLQAVDERLEAAGLTDAVTLAAQPAGKLAGLLGVDGVVYGEITHYERFYAALYAQVAVGAKLRLIDRSGALVWMDKDVARSHAGGVAASPVGLILTALAATWHVRHVNLYRAADDLGRTLAKRMPEPAYLAGNRAPAILQVVHDGAGRVLRYGDTLSVAMEGQVGMKAYARIPGMGLIDLHETQPGMYSGKHPIGPEESVSDQPLVGILRDNFGQSSEWICPLGLINVDNHPPLAVADLKVTSRDNAVFLSWSAPPDADLDAFRVEVGERAQGPFKTLAAVKDTRYEHQAVTNFVRNHYRVIALDRARNESEPSVVAARPTPDARFASAKLLSTDLPARIEDIRVLSPAAGPYTLRGKSELTHSGVLLIEPGTEIRVVPGASLLVHGELQAYGENGHAVRVRSADGAVFGTFLEIASEHPVVLRGLEVHRGGIPIIVTAGQPQIIDSRILDSRFSALEIRGSSRPLIRNTEIRGSHAGGVVVRDQAQPRFENNRFSDNQPFHIQSSSLYRLFAQDNEWKPAPSARTILGDVDYQH